MEGGGLSAWRVGVGVDPAGVVGVGPVGLFVGVAVG